MKINTYSLNKMNDKSYLTAIKRTKMSQPTRVLLQNNLLKENILDFGCGYGKDVEELNKIGLNTVGYDKYYQPVLPKDKFNTIICQFVLNTVDEKEQESIIKQIKSLLKQNGKAYITVRRGIKDNSKQRNVILPFKSIIKATRYRYEIYEISN